MAYIENRKTYKYLMGALLTVLVLVVVISCTMGAASISLADSLKIIISRIPIIGRLISVDNIKKTHSLIVLNIRLPRIILACLVGAGLSVTGSTFQSMFRNPMADPYVLGISSGASLGATIAVILGIGGMVGGIGLVAVFAFAGAILTALVVYNIVRIGSRISTLGLILAGVAVGFFLSSIVSMLMFFNREQMEKIVLWTMGSVSTATWKQVLILMPVVIIGFSIIAVFGRDQNAMSTGDETAKSLGIEVELVKKILLAVCSLIVASCVASSGVIGFVGLIIPHTVRLVLGFDQRIVLPFSAVLGSVFMVLCDTLARNIIPPSEIPVGAITALFGAPFFVFILYKNKRKVTAQAG